MPGKAEEFRKKELDWAIAQLRAASESGFYGVFTVKFEGGRIRRIIEEKSKIPPPIKAG